MKQTHKHIHFENFFSHTNKFVPMSLPVSLNTFSKDSEEYWETRGRTLCRENEFYQELYLFMNFDFTRSIAKKYLLSPEHHVMFVLFLKVYSTFEERLQTCSISTEPSRGKYTMIGWLHALLTREDCRDVRHQLMNLAHQSTHHISLPSSMFQSVSASEIITERHGNVVIWKAASYRQWDLTIDEQMDLLAKLVQSCSEEKNMESVFFITNIHEGTIQFVSSHVTKDIVNVSSIASLLSLWTYQLLRNRISLAQAVWFVL